MDNKNSFLDSVGAFVEKNKRLLGVGIICILVLIFFGVSQMKPKEKAPEGVSAEFVDQLENKEIVSLLKKYYKAYSDGDVKALKEIAYPVSKKEKSYIKMISSYIKSYDIKEVYSKNGADEDSLMLSVGVGIHYKRLKTVAPGLDFFYLEKNDKGKYYINNLYSTFNTQNGELDVDPAITSLIASYEQQDDVVDLQTKVSQEFNEITLKNKEFNVYFTKTLPETITDWASDYKKAEEKAEAKKKKQEKEEKKTAKAENKEKKTKEAEEKTEKKSEEKKSEEKKSQKSEKTKEESKTKETKEEKKTKEKEQSSKKSDKKKESENKEASEATETVYAKADVNVRAKPSTSARVVSHVDNGTKLIRYQQKKGWSQIRYNGEKVWIKSEYLTTKAPKSGSSVASGKKVKITGAVNIRSKRSADSSIVAAVHDGEYITVVKKFKGGWTKVKFNGKTGFMKTELIK